MNTLAVILARGGSKGIPKKNIVDLGGKPLLAWSIDCALGASLVDKLVVSTDDEEIAKVAIDKGVTVVNRPPELAGDTVWSKDALQDAVVKAEGMLDTRFDVVVELNNCCPFRSSEDVDGAINKLTGTGHGSVVSVCEVSEHPTRMYQLEKDRLRDLEAYPEGEGSRRQELEQIYHRNGAIYVVCRDLIVTEHKRISTDNGMYLMPRERSFNIDTQFDLEMCRAWVNHTSFVEHLIPDHTDANGNEYTNCTVRIDKRPTVRIDCPTDFAPDLVQGYLDKLDLYREDSIYIPDYIICDPAQSYYLSSGRYIGLPPAHKALITPSTGTTHIDPDLDIPVYSLSGTDAVDTITASSEFTWALILSTVRKVTYGAMNISKWRELESEYRTIELAGKRLGILGYGRIGKNVAKYAEAMGMDVVWHDSELIQLAGMPVSLCVDSYRTLPDVLNSDIVVCCISYDPKTKDNYHFVNGDMFDKMKRGAYFINTSRGECVDSEALMDAIDYGPLAGAGVDVIENEADYNDNVLIKYAKANPDKLTVTPHIAGCTVDSQTKALRWALDKVVEIAQSS